MCKIEKRVYYQDLKPSDDFIKIIEDMEKIGADNVTLRFFKCAGKSYDNIQITIRLIKKKEVAG